MLRAGSLQMGQELVLEEIKGRVGSIRFRTAFEASTYLVTGARQDAWQMGIEKIT